MNLTRKDYWVSVQEEVDSGAEATQPPVLDYRVLAFSFENNLIIDWQKAFPGPNPTDIVPDLYMDSDLKDLHLAHGIYHFDTKGRTSDKIYHITINTVRSWFLVQDYIIVKSIKEMNMKKFLSFLWNWIAPIAFGIAVYLVITTFLVNVVTINGDSMAPNLLDEQKVLVTKTHEAKRGDVIVFDARKEDPRIQAGNKDYVKRVIGIPGDTVEYRNGDLYVNNKKVNESFISSDEQQTGTEASFGSTWSLGTLSSTGMWKKSDQGKTVVPKDAYFVLGDHRAVSNDSRYFGFVSKEHVVGRVIVPFWYSNTVKKNVEKERNHFFATN